MKILIASPTYDGNVRMEYMQSVLALTKYFQKQNISWDLLIKPATLLHVMRSVMANQVLTDKDYTHLLFIDCDMGFQWTAVKKLIDANKEVVGCAYPYRTIPYDTAVGNPENTFKQALAQAVPYAVRHPANLKKLDATNGVCEVLGIGTGLMLIAKSALEKMVSKQCVKVFNNTFPYNQWYKREKYYGFFDYLTINDAYIGEDYSFCHRWTQDCGGKIYAVVNEEIVHVGAIAIGGKYSEKLQTGSL